MLSGVRADKRTYVVRKQKIMTTTNTRPAGRRQRGLLAQAKAKTKKAPPKTATTSKTEEPSTEN